MIKKYFKMKLGIIKRRKRKTNTPTHSLDFNTLSHCLGFAVRVGAADNKSLLACYYYFFVLSIHVSYPQNTYLWEKYL